VAEESAVVLQRSVGRDQECCLFNFSLLISCQRYRSAYCRAAHHDFGEIPWFFLKAAEKWAAEWNPSNAAISLML
jgi:hypothetical protein